MKLSPQWIRDYVDLGVDNRRLAADLTSVGIAVEGVSGEGENTVFEMEITTNRPDAMNHYGVAREAAAIYDLALKRIEPKPNPSNVGTGVSPVQPRGDARLPSFPIEIVEPDLCPRFSARVLRNVAIKTSPAKIAHRLGLLDQRPISNAVDATNYVLWESGKPTHVYDLDLLEGGKIIIRKAKDGEKLKTLDGVERKLTSEDLVVADAVKPVGLAGVMGGFDTMITEKTKNILIESAWWDPATVRKMSRRHALHTDASHRFERGADFESTVPSCDRVAELILNSGGGELVGGVTDVIAKRIDQAPVALHISEVHRILGEKLETNEIFRILKRLGFELMPERGGDPDFTVHIPSWRLDVEREIDLIEEVARLHGYDKFANTLPAYAGAVKELPDAKTNEKLRNTLLALGYDEAVSLSFISPNDAETFSNTPVIELANPLSEEASIMRTSTVPGMLNMLAYNLNRDIENVRLFELGQVFQASGAAALEVKQLCLGATGSAVVPGVHQPARPLTFYDLKGDVESLLGLFGRTSLYFDANASEYYHPGRSARAVLDRVTVGQLGQIHPEIASARKLRKDVFVAELYLERLYTHGLREAHFQPLPRYPAVERDFSFTFDDGILFQKIRHALEALHLRDLRSFVPVEIFRGGKLPAGTYSILLRAKFQSHERTLRDEEITQWSAQIIQSLQALGGIIRA